MGIHTELVCSGVVDLIKKNVITNSRKSLDRGKIVTSFAMGDREFYDLIDNNPLFGKLTFWRFLIDTLRDQSGTGIPDLETVL